MICDRRSQDPPNTCRCIRRPITPSILDGVVEIFFCSLDRLCGELLNYSMATVRLILTRAGRIELFIAPVLCRVSYRVLE